MGRTYRKKLQGKWGGASYGINTGQNGKKLGRNVWNRKEFMEEAGRNFEVNGMEFI